MTTAQTIIDDAFREANITPLNSSPTTAERTEALARLNAFIKRLYGFEAGELVFDWQVPPSKTSPVDARYPLWPLDEDKDSDVWPYPPPNVQLSVKITTATTIYFPQNPDDGARMKLADAGSTADLTIDGNGRQIEGAASVTVTPSSVEGATWFYRADLANWIRVEADLALGTDHYFPEEFDDFLTIGLARRLAPRNSKAISADSLDIFRSDEKRFRARYRQKRRMPTNYKRGMRTRQSFFQTPFYNTRDPLR